MAVAKKTVKKRATKKVARGIGPKLSKAAEKAEKEPPKKRRQARTVDDIRDEIDELFKEMGYSPLKAMIDMVSDPETLLQLEPKERVAIHKALLPYQTPPLKPDEGRDDGIRVIVQRLYFVPKEMEQLEAFGWSGAENNNQIGPNVKVD